MCTAMYPGLAKHFAFAIGSEMKPGSIGPAQLDAMAHDLGFNPRYVRAVARTLMAELPAALDQVQSSLLEQAAAGTERTLIERLGRWIASNTRKHAKRWE